MRATLIIHWHKKRIEFFYKHINYDEYCVFTNLVKQLATNLVKEKKVDEVLNEYSAGQKISKLPLFIDSIFTRYVTISILKTN